MPFYHLLSPFPLPIFENWYKYFSLWDVLRLRLEWALMPFWVLCQSALALAVRMLKPQSNFHFHKPQTFGKPFKKQFKREIEFRIVEIKSTNCIANKINTVFQCSYCCYSFMWHVYWMPYSIESTQVSATPTHLSKQISYLYECECEWRRLGLSVCIKVE